MRATILCSGNPLPHPERGGTSIVLDIGDDSILIDCGQKTVQRSLEYDIRLEDVESLFFTHQHIDHNADFFYFAISSWFAGRQSLSVYGPNGTKALIDALTTIFSEDLEYRKSLGDRSLNGIADIEVERVTDDFCVGTDSWTASALSVEHSIETFAYRFEEHRTGSSFVFSGDTRRLPELAEFASEADVLVHDSDVAPMSESPDDAVWDRYEDTFPFEDEMQESLSRVHATPREAGEIAAEADVETLVLTHLRPYRDTAAMYQEASREFDGEILIAEDGCVVS